MLLSLYTTEVVLINLDNGKLNCSKRFLCLLITRRFSLSLAPTWASLTAKAQLSAPAFVVRKTAVNFSFENKIVKSCRFKTLLITFSFSFINRRHFVVASNNIKSMTKRRKDASMCGVSVKNVMLSICVCCANLREPLKAKNIQIFSQAKNPQKYSMDLYACCCVLVSVSYVCLFVHFLIILRVSHVRESCERFLMIKLKDLSKNGHQSSFVIAACIALKEIYFRHVSI